MWKIGNVEIKNQIVLAPMAGISNTAYRQIIKEMGAGLIYAEMVSDKAIVFGNQKTLELLKMDEKEKQEAGEEVPSGRCALRARSSRLFWLFCLYRLSGKSDSPRDEAFAGYAEYDGTLYRGRGVSRAD